MEVKAVRVRDYAFIGLSRALCVRLVSSLVVCLVVVRFCWMPLPTLVTSTLFTDGLVVLGVLGVGGLLGPGLVASLKSDRLTRMVVPLLVTARRSPMTRVE